ncbi:angiopoietin-2-like isoform X2 [Haliotis rubra]|uniref:angiopoietin-2-like isoform X2 n=1 Tax=Haliotis rubra TaxID=36100 RepID=UPI001EE572F8|nr:angiopoietin-2-like isoform X2 [Haliotis rubra]
MVKLYMLGGLFLVGVQAGPVPEKNCVPYRYRLLDSVTTTNFSHIQSVVASSRTKCFAKCVGVNTCIGVVYCPDDDVCYLMTATSNLGSVPNVTCQYFVEEAAGTQGSSDVLPTSEALETSSSTDTITTSTTEEMTPSTESTSPIGTTTEADVATCENGGTSVGPACSCLPSTTGTRCETRIKDCSDVSQYIGNPNGTYTVWPTNSTQSFDIECHGVTTMIMFRDKTISGCEAEPVTYLDVPWADYKSGFTHSNCYMWLGLEKVHALTSVRPCKLFMSLKKFDSTPGQVSYDAFSVGDEASEYQLSVSGFTGDSVFGDRFNLGDPARTLDGSHFCAKDHCNNSVEPCAEWHKGAWWNRLDVCQTNPHQQYDIAWVVAYGDPSNCKSIYMYINHPA